MDLLEQIYKGATLAPNNEEIATITFFEEIATITSTFNTGVAQGSVTSQQLFNIFINVLLRMLTATGQNEDSIYGLQIGRDQKEDNQRDKNGYQFNNIEFIDDISLLTHQRVFKSC